MKDDTTTNPDSAPLTIGHGRRLFEQGKTLAAMLDRLAPLLNPTDIAPMEETSDPIQTIVELLTSIAEAQQLHAQRQELLDQKLDFLIEHCTGGALFVGSTE